MNASHGSPARRRRIATWMLAVILCGAILLPVGSHVVAAFVLPAVAQEFDEGKNPRADYWRAVREGASGTTTASGPYVTDSLIQGSGEIYRQVRNGPLATIGPWVLAGILGAIALFHFLVGPMKPKEPLSGRRMARWSLGERVLHWYVAVLFIVLAITGLSLLFGRAVLIPVLGLGAFSAYAGFAKDVHNYLGPFFVVGVLVEVVVWMRYNLFNREDIGWFARLGGMFGGKHPHAGRANAGEKVWFWFIAIAGLIGVSGTGLLLNFPIFGQDRETMQIAQILHAALGTLWIAISFGHIYLGVWGTPGALDGMTKGHVSEEWMKLHHDRWYEKMKREGRGEVEEAPPSPASPESPRSA